jgi:hypothetical protein
LGWFSKKAAPKPYPLWDFVCRYDAEMIAALLERESKTAADNETFLQKVILGTSLACAANFLRSVGNIVRDGIPTASPDVIAFEALAFSIFAIRQFHLPPSEYEYSDEPEALVDAYREVIAQLRYLIEQKTRWSIEKEWNARVMQHAQFQGIMEPIERLNGKLVSLGGVQTPPILYGRPNFDPLLMITVMAGVQAFTVNIPKASAEAIQNIISEFDLID